MTTMKWPPDEDGAEPIEPWAPTDATTRTVMATSILGVVLGLEVLHGELMKEAWDDEEPMTAEDVRLLYAGLLQRTWRCLMDQAVAMKAGMPPSERL